MIVLRLKRACLPVSALLFGLARSRKGFDYPMSSEEGDGQRGGGGGLRNDRVKLIPKRVYPNSKSDGRRERE